MSTTSPNKRGRGIRKTKDVVDARVSRAHELRNQGWLVKDIAVELGLTDSTVSRYLNEIEPPPHGRTLHAREERKVFEGAIDLVRGLVFAAQHVSIPPDLTREEVDDALAHIARARRKLLSMEKAIKLLNPPPPPQPEPIERRDSGDNGAPPTSFF